MEWTSLPPLNALKAFSALAETGSYSAAGALLNVTHAAVMQQVRALEARLGLKLVARSGRGIVLTGDGIRLAHHLDEGFRQISDGIESITGARNARPVQVTMSPAFAVRWLMPRLTDFQNRHPDITLLLNPSGRFMELKPGGLDVAIRYSRRETLPRDADVLMSCDLVVVGTPALLAGYDISTPGDLTRLPWLQELGTNEVSDFLRRHDVVLERPPHISHMPGNLIMDAVRRGDGITYTIREWVVDELRSGNLLELFAEQDAGVFYIHNLPGEKRTAVRAFIEWLKGEIKE